LKQDEQPVGTIKEHVKKRLEASDREFLFGADRVDVRRVKHLKFTSARGADAMSRENQVSLAKRVLRSSRGGSVLPAAKHRSVVPPNSKVLSSVLSLIFERLGG